jgi:hypothetical protein
MKLEEYRRSPCIEVSEEDWREIEATLGLEEPSNEVRISVASHTRRHLFSAELDFPKQRASSQKKWITRIRDKTQHLINVIDWRANEDETEDGYAQMYAIYDLLPEKEEREDLLAVLKELVAKADGMLVRVSKGRPGPDRDDFSWGLVFDLAFLYEWATNKRPTITYNPYGLSDICYGKDDNVGMYEGPFLDFVAAVFAVFAPDRAKGNIALGKHVERVLNVWRRHRGLRTKLRPNL